MHGYNIVNAYKIDHDYLQINCYIFFRGYNMINVII